MNLNLKLRWLASRLCIGGKRFAPAHQEIFVVDRHDNSDDQDDDSEPEPGVDTTLENGNEMETSARSTSMIEDSLEWQSNPYGEMTSSVRAKNYSYNDDSIREEQDEDNISYIHDTSSAIRHVCGW